MRIGLFHCELPQPGRKLGGVTVSVHRLANAMADNPNDQITVFSLDDAPPDARYQHVRLFPRAPWLGTSKLARMLLLPALFNFVDFGNIDLLHLHGDDWFYFNRPCKSVRTLHGSALREAQSSTSRKRWIAQYLTYGFEHLSARLADACLALGDDARRLYDADETVDTGVDLRLFHPGEKSAHPSVLFVGTWAGRKRGEFLFKQFNRLVRPQIPSAELVMVTDQCEPAPGVRWVEFPDDAALAELYRAAWVLAYPSTYEGFGMPYVEAMASGTAVLASPNPGANYVLGGGEFGLIADDVTFGAQLSQLLAEPALRHQYERRGLDRAQRFAWSAIALAHRQVYQAALED